MSGTSTSISFIRSPSPAAASTHSSSSTRSTRSDTATLYGSIDRALHALDYDFGDAFAECLDALDDTLLFAPADAFREMCLGDAVGHDERAPPARTARRSQWVHAAFPTPEEDEEAEGEDVILPLHEDEYSGPLSPLQFRRPSGASVANVSPVYRSSFIHFDAVAHLRSPTYAPLPDPLESVQYFPVPAAPSPAPTTSSGLSKMFKNPLRRRARA